MHIKDLVGNFSGAIFEESPQPTPHTAPAPQSAPTVVAEATTYTPAPDTGAQADRTDDAYQLLLNQTDFAKTPVFQTIQKFVAPLADILPDEKMRFKAAIKQATAQSGFAPESIAAAFEQLKASLTKAADNFATSVDHATAQNVDAKKKQAADLAAQVLSLQGQIAQLSDDAFANQQKIEAGKHRFDTAFQTRQQELAQEAAKYASLLA